LSAEVRLAELEVMSPGELDALDYGVVRMDVDGRVNYYNAAEQRLSGLRADQVLGRHFFSEVAPCTNNFMVAQKYLDNDELDETLDYVFTLRMSPTPVSLRLLRSRSATHQYLLVRRR